MKDIIFFKLDFHVALKGEGADGDLFWGKQSLLLNIYI